jgi:hypothetical protein
MAKERTAAAHPGSPAWTAPPDPATVESAAEGEQASIGPLDERIKIAYEQVCLSYRAIDDFRLKLLGFLPLVTGGGILFLLQVSENGDKQFLLPAGLFGFFVALGLFLLEVYGIRKCHGLISAGRKLEEDHLTVEGQFTTRPRTAWGFVNEPIAAGIIYPVVMAAWIYVAFVSAVPEAASWRLLAGLLAATTVFILGLAAIVAYERFLRTGNAPPGLP